MKNVSGLLAASAEKKERVEKALEKAAQELLIAGEPITKASLARKAGCSWAHVNNSPRWSKFVEEHRDDSKKSAVKHSDARLEVSHAAYDKLLAEKKTLEAENRDLKRRLAEPLQYSESINDLKMKLKEKDEIIAKKNKIIEEKDRQLQAAYDWNKMGNLASYKKMIGKDDLNMEK